ncbi:hypothetical protein [Celeribacter sp.]|uniref:hypothetical protein n=1 Tax=Celeribacter sp. TaxID=1890673 RepID=UPI003A9568AF
MTGFQILKTAIDDVFKNLTDALAISGLLWIGVIAAQVVFVGTYGGVSINEIENPIDLPAGIIKWMFFLNLATLVISLWVAVAWHRFIILGERPTTFIPPMNGARVFAYFVMSLLIGLIVVAIIVVGSVILSPPAMMGNIISIIVGFIVLLIPITYIVYRISPVLPAIALGEKKGFVAAWRQTAPIKVAVFQVGILATLAGFVLRQIGVLFSSSALLSMLYSLASGWVMLMVGVSVFSTIYKLTNSEARR